MPQKLPTDLTGLDLAPELFRELEAVLQQIQERVAAERSVGDKFALIRLVEDLNISTWNALVTQSGAHGWLALPIDEASGVPLETLRSTLEGLVYQRDHDFLTGLANRRLFERLAQVELQRALRTETPLSLVMLDIDNFKAVNDSYGHAVGDKVLVALADLLVRSLRVYDVAARLGGEEFCLLLPGASTLHAADLAERILDDFRNIAFDVPGGGTFSKTFSAGVATCRTRQGLDNVTSLLRQADELLYRAKHKGKNRVATLFSRHEAAPNLALVHVAEKQFLFTGKIAQ